MKSQHRKTGKNRDAHIRSIERLAKKLLDSCQHIVLGGIKCLVVKIPNRVRLIIADLETAEANVVDELYAANA